MTVKFPEKLTIDSLVFRSDFHKCRKIIRAVLARILLICHSCVAIFVVGKINSRYYGIYAPSLFCFLLEMATILYFRWGCEWKRICTCFCCYIFTMVPVLWILRLYELETDNNMADVTNQTSVPVQSITVLLGLENDTKRSAIADYLNGNLSSLVEQSMMILIIICRWMLPRGRIDRDSLTQLLLIYSSISADILDFSQLVDDKKIQKSQSFKYAILGVWSWSLLQFMPVITTSFHFRRTQTLSRGTDSRVERNSEEKSEVVSILMVLFMQDGPFLFIRCGVIFHLNVFDSLIIFFSVKNLITVLLSCYRAMILCGCFSVEGNDLLRKSEIARSMESLDAISVGSVKPKRGKHKGNQKQKY